MPAGACGSISTTGAAPAAADRRRGSRRPSRRVAPTVRERIGRTHRRSPSDASIRRRRAVAEQLLLLRGGERLADADPDRADAHRAVEREDDVEVVGQGSRRAGPRPQAQGPQRSRRCDRRRRRARRTSASGASRATAIASGRSRSAASRTPGMPVLTTCHETVSRSRRCGPRAPAAARATPPSTAREAAAGGGGRSPRRRARRRSRSRRASGGRCAAPRARCRRHAAEARPRRPDASPGSATSSRQAV